MIQSSLLPLAVSSDWVPDAPPDLSQFDEIELDLETTGVDPFRGARPVGFAIGTPTFRQYLPIGHSSGNLDPALVKRWAREQLRNKRIRNLYTQFDVLMMRKWDIDLAAQGCTFHDVSHSAALLDDRRRVFTLDALAQSELGIGKLDLPVSKSDLAQTPAGIVAPYAMRDIELVRRLVDVYRPRLAAEDLGRVAGLEDRVLSVVCELTWNGVPLDQDLLSRWEYETRQLEDQLAKRIVKTCGFLVNPDAPTDMRKLFAWCHEPLVMKVREVKRGDPPARPTVCFDAQVMRDAGERHPAIALVYSLGKLRDLRNKYFVKYQHDLCPDGKLHPTFNQLKTDEGGTVSGRFSSARPNVQQVMSSDKHKRAYGPVWKLFGLPEDSYLVKKLFVPESGTWLHADQAQVEYRIAVHYANAQWMIDTYHAAPVKQFISWMGKEAFVSGPWTDYHAIVGERVKEHRPDLNRTDVKITNFLTIFGGKEKAMAKQGIANAGAFREDYFKAFPEMGALLEDAQRVAEQRGYVKTIDGRRSRFIKGERSHKALNAIVQGSAASDAKAALCAAYDERKTLGLTMRITNHDALCGDLNGPLAPVMEILNTQRFAWKVPVLWAASTGPSWGEQGTEVLEERRAA